MRYLRYILASFLLWTLITFSANGQEFLLDLSCDAPIEKWLARAAVTQSVTSPMLRVGYIIPSNRSPQSNGIEALQEIVQTTQQFYKDHIGYNQFTAKTFQYETEADGVTPFIHAVTVPETDADLRTGPIGNSLDLWNNTINAAILAGLSIWRAGEIWVLIPEVHEQLPDGSFIGGVALGASFGSGNDPGVAMLASHWLSFIHDDFLTNDTPYDGLIIPAFGPFPMVQDVSFASFEGTTLSSVTSSWLGAFSHELGHAFGLPHDFRNDANFHGNLMGNGLRGVRGSLHPDLFPDDYARISYGAAHELNTSHYFNDGLLDNNAEPLTVSIGSTSPQNGHLVFDITASDADGLSVLRMQRDGNAVGELDLSGTSFNGSMTTPYITPGVFSNYVFQLYDTQGNQNQVTLGVTPTNGANRAPLPFVKITPPIGDAADTFVLNANASSDPDHSSSELLVEWDLNFDGVFDTPPDANKQFITDNLTPGNRLIQARLTDPQGAHSLSAPIALFIDGDVVVHVDDFTLIDATTDQPISAYDPIPQDAVINANLLPLLLNIRANTSGPVDRVVFGFDGQDVFNIEEIPPYALFGDIAGDYNGNKLRPGDHTVSGIPFPINVGDPGDINVLSFSIVRKKVKPTITQFILVDSDTDTDLFTLNDKTTLNLSTVSPNPNIRAEVLGPVQSVRFTIDPQGHDHTENVVPYALFGDTGGDYHPGFYGLGEQTITAVAYSQPGGAGEASNPFSIDITFTTGNAPSAQAPSTAFILEETPSNYWLEPAYPNPFNPSTTLRFILPESAPIKLIVYDILGRQVATLVDGHFSAGSHEIIFEAGNLPSGTYLYRLETPNGSFGQRMLLLK